jgi:ectoine hydroxylase-related dioxygenase (phytanoyl-CoA dioxygenase family)
MWRDEIAERGFFIFPKLFSSAELEKLANTFLGARRSRAGVRHALGIPAVAKVARDQRLMEIATAVLGQDAIPFHATLFEKSPSANWLVVWHQDTALPLTERKETAAWGPWSQKEGVNYAHAPAGALERMLALRLHLDDSTVENGPLRVLPGTHNRGVLSDDALHEFSDTITPVECVAPEGAVVAMRPLIAHASSKSMNDAPRRVLHIEYAASREIAKGIELAIASGQFEISSF